MEVVAREGFGALIPSVSDLSDGIRLDPGLMPRETVPLVVTALEQTDSFVPTLLRELGGKSDVSSRIIALAGSGALQLQLVDQLTAALTLRVTRDGGLDVRSVLDCLVRPQQQQGQFPGLFTSSRRAEVTVDNAPVIPISESSGRGEGKSRKPKEEDVDWGYGSDSEDEFSYDDRGTSRSSKKLESEDDDELEIVKGGDGRNFKVRRAAFISGMGAIRIAALVGDVYVRGLIKGGKIKEEQVPELNEDRASLQYFGYDDPICSKAVSHFNVTPQPRNKPNTKGFPGIGESFVSTIDVTNITTIEKGELVRNFMKKSSEEGGEWKILVLDESASKHPTGGDLVYGMIRVVGNEAAVQRFFKVVDYHLSDMDTGYTSTLNSGEHRFRRLLQDRNLMPRNRDLVACVNNSPRDKSHL